MGHALGLIFLDLSHSAEYDAKAHSRCLLSRSDMTEENDGVVG